MLTDKITLQQALELENRTGLFIFDTGKEENYHSRSEEWQENFLHLRTKARHVSPQDIPQYYNARYLIEIPSKEGPHTFTWKYLRGMENPSSDSTPVEGIEYVYALTNEGYPHLVKIGMTTNTPLHRLKQINGTGTVDLWKVRFALPLRAKTGMKVEHQVHTYFQNSRHHIQHKNDREMFEIDIFTAIDKIREIGKMFQVGNPIMY